MYTALGLLTFNFHSLRSMSKPPCYAGYNFHTGSHLPPKLGMQVHETPGPSCSNVG